MKSIGKWTAVTSILLAEFGVVQAVMGIQDEDAFLTAFVVRSSPIQEDLTCPPNACTIVFKREPDSLSSRVLDVQ